MHEGPDLLAGAFAFQSRPAGGACHDHSIRIHTPHPITRARRLSAADELR